MPMMKKLIVSRSRFSIGSEVSTPSRFSDRTGPVVSCVRIFPNAVRGILLTVSYAYARRAADNDDPKKATTRKKMQIL